MTPQRWRQVTALFHAARAREAADRGRFLDEACAGDATLRADVENLLSAEATSFGETPISIASAAHLSPGTTLGPYRVEELIGVGGMGHVYRAADTRLRRPVALKVLKPDLALDPDFGSRFEREAHVLAALNHPNIAAIHGLEESDGLQLLVLEFVEGLTLAERLARGPLPVAEALAVARQIASALEAAHERGIVHRDLKPANLKIAPNGTVKVLDFGIARIVPSEVAGSSAPAVTRTGFVMGTPAYMSPEQARGQAVDKRADVWAFGCVLFELLTGRGAFAAETASDSLAKVIEREPDWSALPNDVPDSIRRLIRRCLQKDPANRLHDIADARIEIIDALSAPSRIDEARAAARPPRRFVVAALITTVLALVGLTLWSWSSQPRSRAAGVPAMEFGVTFPNNYMPTQGIAISPDGRRIAANVWSNIGDIWMQSLDVDGSQPRPLPGGEKATFPFWSPDSTTLGFFQGGQIVTMNATGGARRVITKHERDASGGSWSAANVILFANGGKLFRVAASGSSAPVEVQITGAEGVFSGPVFLPDGRHFIFCADGRDGGSMHLASLDDTRARELGASVCPGGFAPPDHVLFVRGGSVIAQQLGPRLTAEGEPQVVAANVVRGSLGPWPVLTLSASDTGTLVFPASRGGSSLGRLAWFDRDGRLVGAIDPPADNVEYLNPQICPTNGDLVAANRFDPETSAWHIWLIDGARGNAASRLTSDSAPDFDPAWSPDGKEIVYMSNRDGRRTLYRQAIAGGPPVKALDVDRFQDPVPSDVARDGRILFSDTSRASLVGGFEPWGFVAGDSAPTRVGPLRSYGAHMSPDGNWLAYAVTQGAAFEVYVERFPGGVPKKKISANGGTHPRWTSAGSELVYWTPPGGIVSTELVLTEHDIQVGATRTLVREPVLTLIDARTAYDITRDGRKILVRQQAGPPSPGIRVIVNWTARLRPRK